MIIENAEIWYAKLNPKRPNRKLNKENPTWEIQLRTTDKEVKKDWESKNLNVRAVVPDEGEPYFRVNLKKRSLKADGDPAEPPEVVDGDMKNVDPDTIGNGSIANVRIWQREYTDKVGKKGIASSLMGVQLTKHIIFEQKFEREEFSKTETEVIQPTPTVASDDEY